MFASGIDAGAFVGWQSDNRLIRRIRITDTADPAHIIAVDNLYTESVPEPSTIALAFGAGCCYRYPPSPIVPLRLRLTTPPWCLEQHPPAAYNACMSTPDDSELIAVENCRGILGCTLDEAGNVCLDHQVTCKQFSFALKDLDEVIDTLVDFRAAIKAGQVTGA